MTSGMMFSGPVVVVDAAGALVLTRLLEPGLRVFDRDRVPLAPAVAELVAALALVARQALVTASSSDVAAVEVEWSSTSDAAGLLDRTNRQVLNMHRAGKLRGEKVNGVWRFNRADVVEQVAVRYHDRKSSEAIGSPFFEDGEE